jgi:hypothetical protein
MVLQSALPVQHSLQIAYSLWVNVVQEALQYPVDSALGPELKERLLTQSMQLITILQLYEVFQRRLGAKWSRCHQRVAQGELSIERLYTNQIWVRNRHNSTTDSFPLRPDVVCTLKNWRNLSWRWVSASFCSVFAIDCDPLRLRGKVPEAIWGTHALQVRENDTKVKTTSDVRLYIESFPINGVQISRIAVRFPAVFADKLYLGTIAFDSVGFSAEMAL